MKASRSRASSFHPSTRVIYFAPWRSLMNRFVAVTASFVLGLAAAVASQQAPAPRPANASGPDPVFYTEARTTPSTYRDRGSSYAPTYLIYADGQRSPDDGKK